MGWCRQAEIPLPRQHLRSYMSSPALLDRNEFILETCIAGRGSNATFGKDSARFVHVVQIN